MDDKGVERLILRARIEQDARPGHIGTVTGIDVAPPGQVDVAVGMPLETALSILAGSRWRQVGNYAEGQLYGEASHATYWFERREE